MTIMCSCGNIKLVKDGYWFDVYANDKRVTSSNNYNYARHNFQVKTEERFWTK